MDSTLKVLVMRNGALQDAIHFPPQSIPCDMTEIKVYSTYLYIPHVYTNYVNIHGVYWQSARSQIHLHTCIFTWDIKYDVDIVILKIYTQTSYTDCSSYETFSTTDEILCVC